MRNKGLLSTQTWLFLTVALTLTILWMALMPVGSTHTGLGWDKLNHAVAIAVATGLAYLSFQTHQRAASAAFVYGVGLGVLIEILQATLTSTRVAEWNDVVADVIGAGCAWSIIKIVHLRIAQKQ